MIEHLRNVSLVKYILIDVVYGTVKVLLEKDRRREAVNLGKKKRQGRKCNIDLCTNKGSGWTLIR